MLVAAAMTSHIHSEADLATALATLTAADPRLAAVLKLSGPPPLRRRDGGFAGLASIIVSQQLSTASAGAIWARLSKALDPFDAAPVRRARTSTLLRAGLSAAKVKTLKAIAAAITNGE